MVPRAAPDFVPRIALDAFGTDTCPEAELEAALRLSTDPTLALQLVGDADRLEPALRDRGWSGDGITLLHAPRVVTMDDHPARVVRSKPDASMAVCFDRVAQGAADAVVSAGNSGALLGFALLRLGRLPGLDRPAIATALPTARGNCVLLDVGANVDCRPLHLVQFAVMGAAFATAEWGHARPTVGILANGAERSKGTELTRAASAALAAVADAPFEFVGYVEGKDVFAGAADVVVTDGFTGNVALKFVEGATALFGRLLRDVASGAMLERMGETLARPALAGLRDRFDPDAHGGAPLLGAKGLVIVCHGGSSASALENGVRLAARFTTTQLVDRLETALAAREDTFAALRAQAGARAPTA
jgi:glycerol-3-phosphate acyltransferase PlsX